MNNLRELRFKRNVSQILLSQKTEISQSTLSKIERNWIQGTIEQRKKIAEFFKVRKSWLFPLAPKRRKGKNSNEKPCLES